MPGLHIDHVGGGDGAGGKTEAILRTIEVPKDQLADISPEAVLEWVNIWGFDKGYGDTIRLITVDRKPINPHFPLFKAFQGYPAQYKDAPVIELNLIDSNGKPQRKIKNFRLLGDGVYLDVVIKRSQWPENSTNNLAYLPVNYDHSFREIQVDFSYLNSKGQECWGFLIPDLTHDGTGKIDLVVDIDDSTGIPVDPRAINPEYLAKNPNAVLRKFKIRDINGNPRPLEILGLFDFTDSQVNAQNKVCNPTSWIDGTSEAFIYIPLGLNLYTLDAGEFKTPNTLSSVTVSYQSTYDGDHIPQQLLHNQEIIITAYD